MVEEKLSDFHWDRVHCGNDGGVKNVSLKCCCFCIHTLIIKKKSNDVFTYVNSLWMQRSGINSDSWEASNPWNANDALLRDMMRKGG